MTRPLLAPWPLAASEREPRPASAARQARRLSPLKREALWQRALERRLGRLPLITATFLSKLSVPPFGAMGLALAIPLLCAVALGGLLSGLMVLHLRRALAFALMVAVLLGLQVLAAEHFSLGSLALLLVVHMPYIVQLRRPERQHGPLSPRHDMLPVFQKMALLIGLLGIAQYVAQFVIGPALAFPIEHLVPGQFTIAKYNSQGQLHYGSEVMRANGVFMIEPSIFSQLMAVGMVIEIVGRKRLGYLAVMALAILVSYSGTGILLLAVCLVCEGVAKQRWGILLGAAGAAALLALLGIAAGIPMITNVLNRAGEFGTVGSSASMRFVGGFQLFEQFLWPDTFRALFGFGAGSLVEYSLKSSTPFAETILFKPVFEYGIVGAIAYFGFLGCCVLTAPAPMAVRVAVGMAILLGGMYTPFGHCLAFGLLMWRGAPGTDPGGDPQARWARHG